MVQDVVAVLTFDLEVTESRERFLPIEGEEGLFRVSHFVSTSQVESVLSCLSFQAELDLGLFELQPPLKVFHQACLFSVLVLQQIGVVLLHLAVGHEEFVLLVLR